MPDTLTDIQQKLESVAAPIFIAQEMDLIELKVRGQKNDLHIEITADKPLGGITIEECAILHKNLAAAIEQDGFLPPEVFSLEISSPGLDRPLVTRRDFLRSIGQELHFWLSEPVAGKKEVQGLLTAVGESALTIQSTKVPGNVIVPLAAVIKGQLVI